MDHVIVLAAGRGTRAGGPKALHRVGQLAWWQIQAVRLARTRLPITWVVSERVRAGIGEGSRQRMVLADENAPMFSSVVAGVESVAALARMPTPTNEGVRGVFILPVDVPAPEPIVFESLARLVRPPRSEAAIPLYEGKDGHPIYLTWGFVKEAILERKRRPEDRLDELVEGLTAIIGVHDPNVVANLNTPQDFERWVSLNPLG